MRGNGMTAAAASIAPSGAEYRKAITAGVIGNVLEWYDFGVYGYLVPTISALFFPGGDPLVSLLSTFAVFGVGFVMRPVGSILFVLSGPWAVLAAACMSFASIPVVLITTEGSEEQTDRGLALGASAYVKKPFRNEAILDIVYRLPAAPARASA